MDETLTVREKVVTADVLARCHNGQARLCLEPGAVLTPSGWDFVNQHRMEVLRGAAPPAGPGAAPSRPSPREAWADPEIREVMPAVAEDTRILQEGRCEHPDRACGCQTEEFGSGFVEPADCDDCAVRAMPREKDAAACDGCNRQPAPPAADAVDLEKLVRLITDRVLARLREME
jgi:hypothetical protein